jgi:hypothetical protein
MLSVIPKVNMSPCESRRTRYEVHCLTLCRLNQLPKLAQISRAFPAISLLI